VTVTSPTVRAARSGNSTLRRGFAAAIAGLALLVLVVGPALGVSTVDQPMTTANDTLNNFDLQAQTFTVGLAGSLDAVDLEAYFVAHDGATTGTLHASIQALDGSGFPDGTDLSTGSILVTTTPAVVHIAMTPLAVSVGDHLAIVFYIDGLLGTYATEGNTGDLYAGGKAEWKLGAPWHNAYDGFDWVFATYVDPAGTPSPSASASASAAASATASPIAAETVHVTAATSVTPPPTAAGSASSGSSGSVPAWLLPVAVLAGAALSLRVRRQTR
jgi:hypothetical protein